MSGHESIAAPAAYALPSITIIPEDLSPEALGRAAVETQLQVHEDAIARIHAEFDEHAAAQPRKWPGLIQIGPLDV